MGDPLSGLEESLEDIFELQQTKSDQYISDIIKQLEEALDNYKKGPSISMRELVRALNLAVPVIEKYSDINVVKRNIEALAHSKGFNIIWDKFSINSKYPHFQFATSVPLAKNDFISWLSARTGEPFAELASEKQTAILIKEIGDRQFQIRLVEYLFHHPDFLLNLALSSPKNFISLMQSSLGFELENQQIAKAINHHRFAMLHEFNNPAERINRYILMLSELLSKTGHSIDKLLKDPLAKTELDKSSLFRFYQSDEYIQDESNKNSGP